MPTDRRRLRVSQRSLDRVTAAPRLPDLPLVSSLPAIERAVIEGDLVLTAAPGAGKSSLVPLAVAQALDRVSDEGRRVVVLQPRRLAARATAARLAELLDEPVGRSVGLTIRGEHRPGRRIEVVTEAILTNRLQRDPELGDVRAVIFDEFHERNLHSDLGLAMAIEARSTLRPDLRLVVMSATIDPEPIAALLADDGGPVTTIDTPGRVFPVDTEYRARPRPNNWARATAAAIDDAAGRVNGDVLAFAPGRAEIDRVIAALSPATRAAAVIGLHGSSPRAVHTSVLEPSQDRRIIVATDIAETSITIPGVEAVIDGGLSRRPRFDPRTATSHLVTEHVSRFSADQRQGRAGRTRPGICIRMWSASDHELLVDQAAPEIVDGDPLVVASELLRWGDPDGSTLPLLDRPETSLLAAARATMSWWDLTSWDPDRQEHRLTELGRAVTALPTHPRIGALLATLVDVVDPSSALFDLGMRAAAVLDAGDFPTTDDFEREVERAVDDRQVGREIDRLRKAIGRAELPSTDRPQRPVDLGELLATAWPDRIAVRRDDGPRLHMASGRDVELDRSTALGSATAAVVVESTVVEASGRVRRAVPLERSAIGRLHTTTDHDVVEWDRRRRRVVARTETRHGSIVLHRESLTDADPAAVRKAAAEGVRAEGLDAFAWSERARDTRRRLAWLHEQDDRWPDVSDDALLSGLDRWLDLSRVRSAGDLQKIQAGDRLLDLLDWEQRRQFDRLAPTELATPAGRSRRIDWSGGRPVWSVRVQDLFGLDEHPTVGPRQEPLTIELLSPAGRLAQTTTDLPGFWRGSYAAVRADLRGRYPKHEWPENPLI